MKFGLFGINFGPCVDPKLAVSVAKAAEQAGFESLWTGEHVVLPDPQVPPSPVAPDVPMFDPVVALTYIAAHTKTVRLGTGIIILPQRNPLVLAKELASLDVLSGGRLIFGIGIGYLKPEFDALGIPFASKGARTEDYLKAMQAIWTMEKPAHHGKFASFGGVRALPTPAQKPHPEVVFGGHTEAAFDRAARLAKGWYGFALNVETTAKCVAGVKQACKASGRKFEDIEISITPPGAVDHETAKKYSELGVHRLILLPRGRNEAELLAQVDGVKRDLIGKV